MDQRPYLERYDMHGRMVTRIWNIKTPDKNWHGEPIGQATCHDCGAPADRVILEDDGTVWFHCGCAVG